MNDRLPYEEQVAQQWIDLPLPDENMAWADMKRRLEEDDDDGIIPIWLRGCGLWVLIAIILIGIGWWFIRPDKWWNKKQATESMTTTGQNGHNADRKINATKTTDTTRLRSGTRPETKVIKTDTIKNPVNAISNKQPRERRSQKSKDDLIVSTNRPGSKKKKADDKIRTGRSREENKKNAPKANKSRKGNEQVDITIQPAGKENEPGIVATAKDKPVIVTRDSVTTIPINARDSLIRQPLPDSTTKKIIDATTKTNETKKDSSKTRSISFSAGIGMHQLIPIAGQKLTPYNSLGRKGSLLDYIPSAFARMYKNNKWFIQLEFRYGAPQYTKEFTYQQQSKLDSIGPQRFTVTTSTKLKKTFYHQLPVTFNYLVLPNLSVGSGIVWNKFVSAISKKESNWRNNTTLQDSAVNNGIFSDKTDTLFKRSYFQALIETQYQWRRFSLGARYSFGLQPYINFTLPGGARQHERNKSLQFFIRYELWKSKTKSLNEKKR